MKKTQARFSLSFFKGDKFWTILGVIIAFLAWLIASMQLAQSNREATMQNKIAAETFLHNIKTDFFTKETRDLLVFIEMHALHFRPTKADSNGKGEELPEFSIDFPLNYESFVDSSIGSRRYFTSDEIDVELLNHFEDLGILYKKGLISATDIYEYFGYYISLCHENEAIIKYVAWARSDSTNADVFENFDNIYRLVKYMTPSTK